jgi:transcriptional regulator
VWREVRDGDEALVIFRAEHAYVSPNWYPSKHESHRQVPTWNYRVVHVHGTLRVRDDERFVRGVVARLTRRHEGRTGDARPWKMSDSDASYIDDMVTRIVGLEVGIARIVGKWKLGQNKEARDRAGAADALATRDPAMAAAMRAPLGDER